MLYQPDAAGDWGQMLESDTIKTVTEMLKTSDGCNLFLRSWVTNSKDVLLILHGLGAHSGWFIDMGNKCGPDSRRKNHSVVNMLSRP